MAKRAPVGSRELDVDVEDYRGSAAIYAGIQWGQDHPLPDLQGRAWAGLGEQILMAMAMYEAGVAAGMLYGPHAARLEAFWKGYLRGLGSSSS